MCAQSLCGPGLYPPPKQPAGNSAGALVTEEREEATVRRHEGSRPPLNSVGGSVRTPSADRLRAPDWGHRGCSFQVEEPGVLATLACGQI